MTAGSQAGTDTRPLQDRAAIVTGASRGIGLAVSRLLSAAGARVYMIARGAEELRVRAQELGAQALPCDVSLEDDIARITADVGDVDVVVNNAGLFRIAPMHEMSAAEFETTIRTNLVAPFALVRRVLPGMRQRGRGHVVTIGSIADRHVFPENGAYAASKFGARAMHEVLREELRGTGVRATLVSPGPVDTPLWDPIDPDNRVGFTPRRSMLASEAVADAVLYALTRPDAVNVDELRVSRS